MMEKQFLSVCDVGAYKFIRFSQGEQKSLPHRVLQSNWDWSMCFATYHIHVVVLIIPLMSAKDIFSLWGEGVYYRVVLWCAVCCMAV